VRFSEKDDVLLKGVTRFVRRGLDLKAVGRRGSSSRLDVAETPAKFLEAALAARASSSR
jgi:hypothetical protein